MFPFSCEWELTYRCNLDCLHCYCKGMHREELNFKEICLYLDMLKSEGCIFLLFTGGDPFIRSDFLDIYNYAKGKGFFITIFTNGTLINSKIISHLKKNPPYKILNPPP